MKRVLFFALMVVLVSPAQSSADEVGADILKQRCAKCHDLTGPAPQTIRKLWERDAPDLFYAGNKFRREWLVEWLQKPVRIRPAGVNYLRTINSAPTQKKEVKDKNYDVLYGAVLRPLKHLKLKPAEAEAVATSLMKLKPHDKYLAGMKLDRSKDVGLDKGEVLFDKVYGCLSCHQIEPGYGGYTGPEVYNAGRRLQPEFMLSYITRPKNWDPKIWMPNGNVKPDDLQRIVNYLITLSKEDFSAAK
jgi:cytochrome c2